MKYEVGETASHYRIIGQIGQGGMGVVYKAQDLKLDRFVALKFLPPELTRDSEAKERFVHEAKAASVLDHNNICTVYDVDQTADGQMFIAMACYDGETLKECIDRGPLKIDQAIDYALQVAQGLDEAHKHQIVHRDIKSANVLITNNGVAKIVDFGLAKLSGQTRLTKAGSTLGTVAYMSPEQVRGEETDLRTDIWSLGVVLYEMIAGRRPFKGDYDNAVMYSILNAEPEPITGLRSGVPIELERIVKKAMEKDRSTRYQTAGDLMADLRWLKKELESRVTEGAPTRKVSLQKKRMYLYGGLVAFVAVVVIAVLYIVPRPSEVINSIAVLPLENLSHDPEQEYFSDGMTEALITELSQIQALRVISRTSIMQYKEARKPLPEIARELKVDAVIEGSVLRVGDKVRITAQLIKAVPEQHLWAQSYDRDIRDVLVLHSEVARAIANQIKIKLTPQEQARLASARSVNPEAHEAYLKGRYYVSKFTKEGLQKGLEYFNQAIAIDPLYALAYDGLAFYYTTMDDWFLSPREAMPKAKAAAQKALEIDETLAEAHSSLGVIKMWYDWDWLGAQREFKRAIELNPNSATAHDSYALSLALIGLHDDALAVKKRALEFDPLSINVNATLGATFYDARRYDLAIEQLRKTFDMDPNFWFAHFYLGRAYVQKGEFAEALAEFQKAGQLEDTIPEILGGYGYALAVSGRRDEAQKMIDELMQRSKQSYISPYNIAIIYVGLGAKDQAFEWLEKAYEDRSSFLSWLKVNPELDGLRSDPRFTALMKKVGFEK